MNQSRGVAIFKKKLTSRDAVIEAVMLPGSYLNTVNEWQVDESYLFHEGRIHGYRISGYRNGGAGGIRSQR